MTDNTTEYDLCCIGHITRDRIITPDFTADMPGGTAFYFAKALRSLDHSGFKLVTSVGPGERQVTDDLRRDGIDVEVIPSRNSVFFENKYGTDRNERTQRVLAKADPFTVDNLAADRARFFHLGTLLSDDFPIEVMKDLSSRGTLSVDIQGYLRKVEGEKVVPADYNLKREAMPYIHILKANEKEMETLTGSSDPEEAARILGDWGCREVVLTLGDKGSVIYENGVYHRIPAYRPAAIVDATGCGDTYMAGYLMMRARGADCDTAGKTAAAMCSLKLAYKGPFSGTAADIERTLETGEVMA